MMETTELPADVFTRNKLAWTHGTPGNPPTWPDGIRIALDRIKVGEYHPAASQDSRIMMGAQDTATTSVGYMISAIDWSDGTPSRIMFDVYEQKQSPIRDKV